MHDDPIDQFPLRSPLQCEASATQTLEQIYQATEATKLNKERETKRQSLSSGECPELDKGSFEKLYLSTGDPVFRAAFNVLRSYLGALEDDGKDFDDQLRQITQQVDLVEAERKVGASRSPGVLAALGAYPAPSFVAAKQRIKRAREKRKGARERYRCDELESLSRIKKAIRDNPNILPGDPGPLDDRELDQMLGPFGDTGDLLLVAKIEWPPLVELDEATSAACIFERTRIEVATPEEVEPALERWNVQWEGSWSQVHKLAREVPREGATAKLRDIMWVRDDRFARRAVATGEVIVLKRRDRFSPGGDDVAVSLGWDSSKA